MKIQFFLIFSLFTVFVVSAPAQSSIEQTLQNARDRFSDIKNRSIELERIEREAHKQTPPRENNATKFPEIKEDFEQIQKLNDNLFQLNAARAPLNYADVLKLASEINHRAARLKSNLFSTEPDEQKDAKNKQQIIEQPDIKILLGTLDKSISSFVHSAIFQNKNVVNSQDLLKAQNDLETVIKVSFSVKEKAKKTDRKD
ncbi:MAG: hypothetical protein ACR2N3_02945 [Pyrinomonadaceae bacterium]